MDWYHTEPRAGGSAPCPVVYYLCSPVPGTFLLKRNRLESCKPSGKRPEEGTETTAEPCPKYAQELRADCVKLGPAGFSCHPSLSSA